MNQKKSTNLNEKILLGARKRKFGSHSAEIKADSIIYSLGLPNQIYDSRLMILSSKYKRGWDYAKRNNESEVKRVQEIVQSYTKDDVEEAIVNELHELGSMGVGVILPRRVSEEYKGKSRSRVVEVDVNDASAFKYSSDNIVKLNHLLSNKQFLIDHGLTEAEIASYKTTFRKRASKVVKDAVNLARTNETKDIAYKIKDYAIAEGLLNNGNLEGILKIISSCFVLTGILFLRMNLTGNFVGNSTKVSLDFFGVVFFVLGILGFLFTFKNFRFYK